MSPKTSKMNSKIRELEAIVKRIDKVAIALSGGLDSSALVAFCADKLGANNCLALTIKSPYMMQSETDKSENLCKKLGVKQTFVSFEIPDDIRNNPPNRCYLCKKNIFSALQKSAIQQGFQTLCDGTNVDDLSDYRPGMKAIKELGVYSPFLEAKIGKAEIAEIAKYYNIEVSPAYACLLTRLEHNRTIEESTLQKIDNAEQYLRKIGFDGVRVRIHSECCRIEIQKKDFDKFCQEEIFSNVSQKMREIGFKHSALDLSGYSRGSMNKKDETIR